MSHVDLIAKYRKEIVDRPDTWFTHAQNQQSIELAIIAAGMSINHLGKRHPHQYRLKEVTLREFTDRLRLQSQVLVSCGTFDELHSIVKSCKVHGIGDLAIYDTTHRIAGHLKLDPEFIYLHAGTRIGLEKLIGKFRFDKIKKADLPEPFKTSELKPSELEDLLCHMGRALQNHIGLCFNKRKKAESLFRC